MKQSIGGIFDENFDSIFIEAARNFGKIFKKEI